MAIADEVYIPVIRQILAEGVVDKPENVRPHYEDGTPATTKSILNVHMKYDNSGDAALLLTQCSKPTKDPLIETLWIWQKMSNNVQELRDAGCKVWNQWENKRHTIGKAYGWQLKNKKRKVIVDDLFISMLQNQEFSFGVDVSYSHIGYEELDEDGVRLELEKRLKGKSYKLNQVDYLIYSLKSNPYSRRIRTTLYCIEDLDEMELEPCVYETEWKKQGDTLALTVGVRGNDMALNLAPSVRNGSRTTLLKRETLTA